ncbi:hypothetical protein [Bartonella bovis]|uniref:Putative membrane protein n=1 Tax=Bartonella bovis m02 TaxID=1094492 RepID=N6V7X8_9HYPH|nr:hypothetical protein [Bartonella bovis]ENN89935.1 putative membrane protein [Bartonella bovis m02]
MDKKIHARLRYYRRKAYRKITVILFAFFLCVLIFYFAVQKIADHFFFTKQIPQHVPVKLVIPAFDLYIYCKEIAASVLPDIRGEVYSRCLRLESEAYFTVREMWEEISDNSKEKCVKVIRPGDGNYFLLRDCLINEQDENNNKMRNYF